MHHSGTTFDRAADRTRVQQVIAVEAVEASDIVANTLQVRRYRGTYMTAMTSDQDPHVPMVAECLNQSTGFGHDKVGQLYSREVPQPGRTTLVARGLPRT
jgi:hypothetical protein